MLFIDVDINMLLNMADPQLAEVAIGAAGRLVTGLRRIKLSCCSTDAQRINSAQVCHLSCVDACAYHNKKRNFK